MARASNAEYQRRYRQRHPDRVAAARKNHHARRYRIGRALMNQIKLSRGCADCGYRGHPAALDFDHRPGEKKTAAVSGMWGNTPESIMAEIAKCDVVCANCHRVRTWRRRQSN